MATPMKDWAGRRFGRLTIEDVTRFKGTTWALCQCDCGNACAARVSGLVAGHNKACGCLRRESVRARRLKHDEARDGQMTPEYKVWLSMKARCRGNDEAHARIYKARGIVVCAEWVSDFAAFLAHVGRKPSADHSLDRIDNDGNYEPGNVRWATRSEQAKNRRERPRDANNQNWIGGTL